MMAFDLHLPTRLVAGIGRTAELARSLPKGVRRVLVVTDRGLVEGSDALDQVMSGLDGIEVSVFDRVEANPSFATAENAGARAREGGAEVIVGLGGGSPMDAAKAAAVAATNPEGLETVLADGSFVAPLPVVCIPTTSGTGSEVTPFIVLTDREAKAKRGFANPRLYPGLAVVDPALTYSMPASLIVDTGLDVLTHAVEAHLSLEASAVSDLFALRAVEIVRDRLPAAAGRDRSAMGEMALAATLAGVAIAHAGTTLLHVMGYPLTVFHDVPHGRASACMLPQYLSFLGRQRPVPASVQRIEEMLKPVGGAMSFIEDLGVSTRLGEHGVGSNEIPGYVERVIGKDDLRITPARVGRREIAELYQAALAG